MMINKTKYKIEVDSTGHVLIVNDKSNNTLEFNMDDRSKTGGFLIRGNDIDVELDCVYQHTIDSFVIQETVYQKLVNDMTTIETEIMNQLKALDGHVELPESFNKYALKSLLCYDKLNSIKKDLIDHSTHDSNLIEYTVRVMQTKNLLDIKTGI